MNNINQARYLKAKRDIAYNRARLYATRPYANRYILQELDDYYIAYNRDFLRYLEANNLRECDLN